MSNQGISFYDDPQNWEKLIGDEQKLFYFSKLRERETTKYKPVALNISFQHKNSEEFKQKLIFDYTNLTKYFLAKYAPINFLSYLNKSRIIIYDPKTWQDSKHHLAAKPPKLPASRFLIVNKSPVIEMILPIEFSHKDSSQSINNLRLFCGDVLGKLIFDFSVFNRFPFQKLKYSGQKLNLLTTDKAQILRFIDEKKPSHQTYFLSVGKNFASNSEQKISAGRDIFFKDLIYNKQPRSEYQKQALEWWREFNGHFNSEFQSHYSKILSKLQQVVLQIKLFLPEDRALCQSLVQQEKLEAIHLISTRISFLHSGWKTATEIMLESGILSGLGKHLYNTNIPISELSETEKLDFNNNSSFNNHKRTIDEYLKVLSSLQNTLLASNLAKSFLIPDEIKQEQHHKSYLQFKLWLHQCFYVPVSTKFKKEPSFINEELLRLYQTNAFQGLYIFCEYLKLSIGDKKFLNTYQKSITRQLNWYILNKHYLEDIPIISSLILESHNKKEVHTVLDRLQEMRKGWASFLSNALIIDFFVVDKSGELLKVNEQQIKQFKDLIYRTSLEDLIFFSTRLTAIFLHIFRLIKEDLGRMFALLNPGHPQIDSWIENGFPDSIKSKEEILNLSKKLATNFSN